MPKTTNPEVARLGGLTGDIDRACAGATATAGELREFVSRSFRVARRKKCSASSPRAA